MPTDSQFILESISQGCVMLAEDEFVIDRLVKYFGNGQDPVARRVPWASHRIHNRPAQEAAYLPQEDARTGRCAAAAACRGRLQAMGARSEEECHRASLAG